MAYIIGVTIGGAIIMAFYELIVLPLLVGRPRAFWGKAPTPERIESAPRDGTVVDLWMDEDGRGWREADAYYVTDRYEDFQKWDPTQQRYVRDGARRRDGWWGPNHDYDGADGWCDIPRYFNEHPRQQKWVFREPTHWMPLPAPPEQEEAP